MAHVVIAGADEPGQTDDLGRAAREREVAQATADEAVDGDVLGAPRLGRGRRRQRQPPPDDRLDEVTARGGAAIEQCRPLVRHAEPWRGR